MEQAAKDLKINGIGKVSGGTYGKITTDGIATVNGEVLCSSLTANGTLKLKDSIQAGQFRLNGNGSTAATIGGGKFRVDGMFKVDGNVQFEEININGMLKAEGSAVGERADIDGGLNLGGSAEYEYLKVHGQIQVDGMINAGEMEILMAGPCRAKEIGGGRIQVRKKTGSRFFLALLSPSLATRLTAEVIEGDEIVLEDTTAKVVRGNSVRIGSGCEIGRVEYKHHYEADSKASVGIAEQV
ncbi:polymer-forming cytoskeletal protein [Paenibacillus anaericanus]|uniref:Polymer-forming cytoskeletal protein n=1 Tax=Paenibacillus anaericanus TaxID=170367 RepID=A0A3S1K3B7_9BACL|nr:polymer-forming cytoskeletal protein [Paenibacillus anaericanus]RUT42848.1 polymer-forming cytoskeletal protein [Paenibacillus anaericanus]